MSIEGAIHLRSHSIPLSSRSHICHHYYDYVHDVQYQFVWGNSWTLVTEHSVYTSGLRTSRLTDNTTFGFRQVDSRTSRLTDNSRVASRPTDECTEIMSGSVFAVVTGQDHSDWIYVIFLIFFCRETRKKLVCLMIGMENEQVVGRVKPMLINITIGP